MLNKNFIALDLELNNAPDNSTPNPKIIQVGVAVGNMEMTPDQYITKKWYLDPREPIFPFITELTGISDSDIEQYSVSRAECAIELSEFIIKHQPFTNPITWGGGDSSGLLSEFKSRDIHFPHFGRRWIDVKTIYTYLQWAKGKNTAKSSLNSALNAFKMKFDGEQHRADNDAKNTLALFFRMLKRQNDIEEFVRELK